MHVIRTIAFCAALSGVILANLFVLLMIGEINRKKEDGEYRRLYPNGKLHIYALAMFALGMIALFVVAVLYRFL